VSVRSRGEKEKIEMTNEQQIYIGVRRLRERLAKRKKRKRRRRRRRW